MGHLFVVVSLVSALLAGIAGCSQPPGSTGSGGAGGNGAGGGGGGSAHPTRDVDLLVVFDNSLGGAAPSQQRFIESFPSFLAALEGLPGGMPNLHLAVITTDLGAGDGTIQLCQGSGQGGVFQHQPRSPCTDTTLEPGTTFIVSGSATRNHTAPLAEVFSCIANVGDAGCGFERPLAAIARALGADGRPAPPENEGFLRRDAILAVVLVENDDDCSAASEAFYDTASNRRLDSRLGPVGGYRCHEFGHLCGQPKRRPPRYAPTGTVGETVELSDCISAESYGMMVPVTELASGLKGLKDHPESRIVVSAITGPPTPYVVYWEQASIDDTGPWPVMRRSCESVGDVPPLTAVPAVRIHEWTRAFGDNGLTSSFCAPTYGPALEALAGRLGTLIAP